MLHKNHIKLVADNSEHVPLLVMKQNESSSKNRNGLQLIENISEQEQEQFEEDHQHQQQSSHIQQSQISPVLLSSSVHSQVMKSRLNQYNKTGGLNSVVVRLNDENETETMISGKASSKKNKNNNYNVNNKNFAEI